MVRGVRIIVAALAALGVVLLTLWGVSFAMTGVESGDARLAGVALFVGITTLTMAAIGFVSLRSGHLRD